MDYSLAKLLKDAGFYQSGKGTRIAPHHMIVVRRDDFAYVPTLEELVEACGKGLWTMRQCTYHGNGAGVLVKIATSVTIRTTGLCLRSGRPWLKLLVVFGSR